MLVSAINANGLHSSKSLNKNAKYIKDSGKSAFGKYDNKALEADNGLLHLYNSINIWKMFCETQISKGNIDILV